ncbi:evolutionarily conserved signaling intermediate in Toll pathway, mitochondrial [Fopius arisanus]|uniref:Evolutionarily conserved signaling intermediate in Toll pathway, mitochondrial n=1 Tax=Fopius arisanus TaxID=64838 RepID=A0A9R1TTH1_9HYME|nr:PREDICTED: evolutionarily conserved signaling intermediate in Toll pathway, mitochondrial [Fopius arisanus]XP_011314995.1 PREDICTED: evolutionarily conserved signaling intermediate in Toll pathway, mitochondrial [Fopius arisanus]
MVPLPTVTLAIKGLRSFPWLLPLISPSRLIQTSPCCLASLEEDKKSEVSLFKTVKKHDKEKETYLNVIYTYKNSPPRKTGHVQFIYAAMRYMDEFGVNEDLEVYKAVMDTMPKGRFVSRTLMQAELMLYPREQQCAIEFLEKMENNGVIPDEELEMMLINIFGDLAVPLRKLRRMTYWQGKFKNLNPWPWPHPMPNEPLELAKIAIEKIATVDVQSTITVFHTDSVKESIDKTWIVSASSPDQERLIAEHPQDVAAYVEGPFKVWVSKGAVDYFLLRADPLKNWKGNNYDKDDVSNFEVNFWKMNRTSLAHRRAIHEQDEQTIFGICATGTSSKDSLLSWIRCLQPRNPMLEKIPILFKFRQPVDEQLRTLNAGQPVDQQGVQGESVEKIEN